MSSHTRKDIDQMQNDIDNNTAINRAMQSVMTESAKTRPTNTTKAYLNRQEEFRKWCLDDKKFADGVIVYEGKLLLFLNEVVIPRGNRKRKTAEGQVIPLGKESIYAYVKAMTDMWKQQGALGNNSHPHPRGAAINALMDTIERKEVKRKRDTFEDRGVNTLNDGYTKKELVKVSVHFLAQDTIDGIRNRLDFLLGHAILGRGEPTRSMQLPDLFCTECPGEGPTKCIALVITMNKGKTNQHGRLEFGAAMRHQDVNLCAIGALGFYFFARWHMDGEPFPDMSTRQSWYNIYVFRGDKSNESQISYNAQSKAYNNAIKVVEIVTSKVTHINRGSALREISEDEVAEHQLRRVGRWGRDRMVGCYMSSLPKQAMRALAGFYAPPPRCILAKTCSTRSPSRTATLIFPEVDYWQERFKRGEVQQDIAGPNFLDLLKYLRVVILQDAAVLKQEYPDLTIWKNEVFQTSLFTDFQARLIQHGQQQETPIGVELEKAMPHMTEVVKTGFDSLSSKIGQLENQIESVSKGLANVQEAHEIESNKVKVYLDDIFRKPLYLAPRGHSLTESTMLQEQLVLPPSSPSVSTVSSSVSPVASASIGTAYKLNRQLRTVVDVWREYDEGIGNDPAVRNLETQFGTSWRKDRTESRYYSRRKVLYDEVVKIAVNERIYSMEAARLLEKRRQERQLTLDGLCKTIEK